MHAQSRRVLAPLRPMGSSRLRLAAEQLVLIPLAVIADAAASCAVEALRSERRGGRRGHNTGSRVPRPPTPWDFWTFVSSPARVQVRTGTAVTARQVYGQWHAGCSMYHSVSCITHSCISHFQRCVGHHRRRLKTAAAESATSG